MEVKNEKKQTSTLKPVLLRLDPDTLAWIDHEAHRQRRSRAFVVGQAARVYRAIVEQLERERAALE